MFLAMDSHPKDKVCNVVLHSPIRVLPCRVVST